MDTCFKCGKPAKIVFQTLKTITSSKTEEHNRYVCQECHDEMNPTVHRSRTIPNIVWTPPK